MTCPLCALDQQQHPVAWHLVEAHGWTADAAEAWYKQQIDRILEETRP